jgi:ribonuclease P/MRP protein subunit POP1
MIKDDKIPIILVQRSLASETSPEDQASAIHGYTLFVPAGWAMPFWQSLVFTGSLIMGMEERATQYLEAGVPGFPECFPLTKTGGDWWVDKMDGKKKRWERRPPGKRMEYDVLKLEKPWDVCWNGVLGVEGTWIVPDWVLQGLQAGLRGGAKDMQTLFWRVLDKCSVALGLDKVPDDKRQQAWETALVHVSLTTVGRGSPKDHAEICEISDEERESLAKEEDVGVCNQLDLRYQEYDPDCKPFHFQELQAPSPTNDSTRVGYVLAGTQSLARGKGHAIAAVSLSRFLHIPLAVVSTGKTDARGQLIKFRNSEGLIWRYAVLRLVI